MNAILHNTTISRLHTQWSCPGATIGNPTADSSSFLFPTPGSYTVTLTTGNDKNSQSVTQTIIVLPNTNLRTLTNVHLGINTAQSTVGCFYSTKLRKVFTKNDQPDTAGKWIDIVFFGLNSSFTYNKFLTPDSAQYYTFAAIPQVSPTVFINAQEQCGCGIGMPATDFDNMTNDGPLQGLNISSTSGDWHNFDNTVAPRIVLFQAHDGRKGAIKIKQFVQNGTNSYIIADIKVQKNL
jgi:PKD repeat protein